MFADYTSLMRILANPYTSIQRLLLLQHYLCPDATGPAGIANAWKCKGGVTIVLPFNVRRSQIKINQVQTKLFLLMIYFWGKNMVHVCQMLTSSAMPHALDAEAIGIISIIIECCWFAASIFAYCPCKCRMVYLQLLTLGYWFQFSMLLLLLVFFLKLFTFVATNWTVTKVKSFREIQNLSFSDIILGKAAGYIDIHVLSDIARQIRSQSLIETHTKNHLHA